MKWDHYDPNREAYERDLHERQRRHLERVSQWGQGYHWRPCMHDNCQRCHGTGVQLDGQPCIHAISCPCPRCSPAFL